MDGLFWLARAGLVINVSFFMTRSRRRPSPSALAFSSRHAASGKLPFDLKELDFAAAASPLFSSTRHCMTTAPGVTGHSPLATGYSFQLSDCCFHFPMTLRSRDVLRVQERLPKEQTGISECVGGLARPHRPCWAVFYSFFLSNFIPPLHIQIPHLPAPCW